MRCIEPQIALWPRVRTLHTTLSRISRTLALLPTLTVTVTLALIPSCLRAKSAGLNYYNLYHPDQPLSTPTLRVQRGEFRIIDDPVTLDLAPTQLEFCVIKYPVIQFYNTAIVACFAHDSCCMITSHETIISVSLLGHL